MFIKNLEQMRIKILLLFTFITTQISYSQIDTNHLGGCYVIQFVQKNSVIPDSLILPIYQKHGFQIVENGVYDFVIDGKKYFQALLIKIDNSGFQISQNWEFVDVNQLVKDTVNFSSSQDIKIRMVSIDKGRGGLPFTVGKKDYSITFVRSGKYCRVKNAVITTGNEIVQGHFYFTDYGWKKIKIVKRKPYLCDESGVFQLRRK